MHPLVFLLIFFGPLLVFAFGVWRLYMQNVIRVKPNNIERAVIENVATGQLRVLGPGAHPLGPGWRELDRARVQLNREPVQVPSEEVRSSDGVRLEVGYRFDMISGRPFHLQTGQIGIYDPVTRMFAALANPDDRSAVRDEMVVLAVTAINFAEREKRILEILEASFEQIFGEYTGEELTVPAKVFEQESTQGRIFRVPRRKTRLVSSQKAQNTAILLRQLARLAEERANLGLLHVGINVVDLQITNLRYKDPKVQEALENSKKLEKLKQAAQQLMGPDGLALREALTAGTDQYGTVVLGEAGRDAARSIGEGLRNFGRG